MDTGTVGESSQMEGGCADAADGKSAPLAAMLVQRATKETTGRMSHAGRGAPKLKIGRQHNGCCCRYARSAPELGKTDLDNLKKAGVLNLKPVAEAWC